LITTAPDYARFLAGMLNPGACPVCLSDGLMAEMLTPQIKVGVQKDLYWGLGWGLQHIPGWGKSFWHWGARRQATRSFVMGHRERQSGVVILTDHANGLVICEKIAQIGLGCNEPFPAFRWLLPAESWRADGIADQ
jgi:CubicO group peptidase (beta-lactamase class C family)